MTVVVEPVPLADQAPLAEQAPGVAHSAAGTRMGDEEPEYHLNDLLELLLDMGGSDLHFDRRIATSDPAQRRSPPRGGV